MTPLVLTITPARAVLTQDTSLHLNGAEGLESAETAPSISVEEAAKRTFIGDGAPPPRAHLEEVQKIAVLSDRRMIIGVAGAYRHASLWPLWLAIYHPEGDVSEIAEQVPATLRRLVKEVEALIPELVIVHAGWSERERRVIGYAYERSTDFAPLRLEAGHTMAPVLHPTAPDYEELCELWMEALEGRCMEEFHAAAFRNQRWSYQQGLLRRGAHIGPNYISASVDRDGARLLRGLL